MALNSSGPISLGGTTAGQSIALENGGSGTSQISLNDAAVRSLAGVASGQITMPTNFWGKSNTTYFIGNSNEWRPSYFASDASNRYWMFGKRYSSGRDGYLCVDGVTGALVTQAQYNNTGYANSSVGAMYNPTNSRVTGVGYRSYMLNPSTFVTTNAASFTTTFSQNATVALSNGTYFSVGTYQYYDCGYFYRAGFVMNSSSPDYSRFYGTLDVTDPRPFSFFYGAAASGLYGYAVGQTSYNGDNYGILAKFDYNSSGALVANIGFRATAGGYLARGIALDSSSNVFTTSGRDNTADRVSITKWTSSFSATWNVDFTGTTNMYPAGCCTDSSGNVYAMFSGTSTGSVAGTFVVKLNSSGAIQWQRVITTTINGSQFAMYPSDFQGAFISSDGALVLSLLSNTAYNGSKPFLAKIPTDGSKTGTYSYTDTGGGGAWVVTIAASSLSVSSPGGLYQTTTGFTSGGTVSASTAYFTSFAVTDVPGWGYRTI